MFIQGIDVVLYTTETTGTDEFGVDIVEEKPIVVSNVLVGQPTDADISDSINIHGRKIVYNLCIPKGDTNNWENKTVEFFGRKFRTFGSERQYIDALVPLSWNKQIKVEAFEEWENSLN